MHSAQAYGSSQLPERGPPQWRGMLCRALTVVLLHTCACRPTGKTVSQIPCRWKLSESKQVACAEQGIHINSKEVMELVTHLRQEHPRMHGKRNRPLYSSWLLGQGHENNHNLNKAFKLYLIWQRTNKNTEQRRAEMGELRYCKICQVYLMCSSVKKKSAWPV